VLPVDSRGKAPGGGFTGPKHPEANEILALKTPI